jgi:hypothetical protein
VANLLSALLGRFTLAAAADPWKQTTQQLRENSEGVGSNLLVLCAVFTAVTAVWCLVQRWVKYRRERTIDDPGLLFHDLCRAQRLSRKEKSQLVELAERRGLEDPSALFVREDYFDGEDVATLREKLFA